MTLNITILQLKLSILNVVSNCIHFKQNTRSLAGSKKWNIHQILQLMSAEVSWKGLVKVPILWVNQKIVQTLVYNLFDKSKVEISQNFVAFSEYLYEL